MKDTLSNVLIFAAGAAVGVLVTKRFFEAKYKKIADEEIESTIEAFSRRESLKNEPLDFNEDGQAIIGGFEDNNAEVRTYESVLSENGYTDYSGNSKTKGKGVSTVKKAHVEVIDPNDFGDEEYGYDTVSLILYADNVLTYEDGRVIKNVDEVVGSESLNHFDEYDSVYVRNYDSEIDYEILADLRKYIDVFGRSPHQAEVE